MELDFSFLLGNWTFIAKGVGVTAVLSLASISVGFAFGGLVAIARRSRSRALSLAAGVYVEIIRNTPLLIQIFLTFFGLATLGVRLPATLVAVLAMTINTVAYTSEIIRAGLDSVKPGQWEAADSLGLSRAQTYWYVAFLPSIQSVYPSLCSQFVLMLLATSITSQISVEELTAVANFLQAEYYRPFETYIAVALLYLALSLALRLLLWAIGLAIFPQPHRNSVP